MIQSNNNSEIIIICDSGIQRIGYHFLYNLGVKIERDKSENLSQQKNNGGDLKQYALPKGRRKELI